MTDGSHVNVTLFQGEDMQWSLYFSSSIYRAVHIPKGDGRLYSRLEEHMRVRLEALRKLIKEGLVNVQLFGDGFSRSVQYSPS